MIYKIDINNLNNRYPTIDGGRTSGKISIVSHIFFPGSFVRVITYAAAIPRMKAMAVAMAATFNDKITGSIIILNSYLTVNPYFSKTFFAKSLCRNSKKSAAASA